MGPSGGGKSTIARLIARFLGRDRRQHYHWGKNIKELSIRQLSELVSFVTQDNFLFNCSLKENIRLGNQTPQMKKYMRRRKRPAVMNLLCVWTKDNMIPLPVMPERGCPAAKNSNCDCEGDLKNAPIVILDEATAFTDPQNEDKIQKSIMALSKGKTLLVIAHRLSTIQNADQIVVLKKGRIVDCGKQEELLKRCPLYADMWKAHIRGEEVVCE